MSVQGWCCGRRRLPRRTEVAVSAQSLCTAGTVVQCVPVQQPCTYQQPFYRTHFCVPTPTTNNSSLIKRSTKIVIINALFIIYEEFLYDGSWFTNLKDDARHRSMFPRCQTLAEDWRPTRQIPLSSSTGCCSDAVKCGVATR